MVHRAGGRAVDFRGPSVYQGGGQSSKSRCLQKSKLVNWGSKQGCEFDRILFEFNYFSKSEFKLEFSNLIIYEFNFELDKNKLFRVQVRVQADK